VDDRPVILCIVGFQWEGGCRSVSVLLTLAEAEEIHSTGNGWSVMVDPWGKEALARWHQLQQSGNLPRLTW
jgi:hypothetical protein